MHPTRHILVLLLVAVFILPLTANSVGIDSSSHSSSQAQNVYAPDIPDVSIIESQPTAASIATVSPIIPLDPISVIPETVQEEITPVQPVVSPQDPHSNMITPVPVTVVQESAAPSLVPDVQHPLSVPALPAQVISYPSLGLYTGYGFSVLDDFFNRDITGNIDYKSPKDTDSASSSVQQKLKQFPLHVAFTVAPGQMGNAYFIAHNYTYFSPLQMRGAPGDIIYISDGSGKSYTYRVYEARTISVYDTDSAYMLSSMHTTITLQTCTTDPSTMWIIRAELV